MIFRHIDGVVAEAIFSPCERFRYRLTVERSNSPSGKVVCVIMQNPSVANSDVADKSVQFLEKLIFIEEYEEFKGVNRIIVVNQFAFVQTNEFAGTDEHIGTENDYHIEQSLDEADIVLIAWGSGNAYQNRQQAINAMLTRHQGKTLLKTNKHPSRGTYNDFVEPYRI
ncbi:hypothetical protein BZG20_11390 [Salinivibrio sp. IB868]|uniref:DUF1643 domain-containing protein n=1 Tax=unclassified Salinivibrio TaxID=2636825 RepID=UPI000984AECC|nr:MULTISPECIES: DUF1643 domain-containing protein [unclassified Salinivibrio]OOE65981.1 hypothetical protein BZG20_11390 [Salinivibrio sp. IB868]OOE76712.1 hypothetical protein BZG22_03890 [Salinivibrio sp. IB870]